MGEETLHPEMAPAQFIEKVNLVTIEILISNGKTKIVEFTSTKQASEFLKEFKLESE